MYDNKLKIKNIGNYQIAERIGGGAVGVVFKGVSETGEIVAIKQISMHNISNDKFSSIETEIGLLSKLNHPNIVKYKGNYSLRQEYIRQKGFLNIVLEYIEGGSLHGLVKKSGPLPEKIVHIYIKQVLEGLEYLHKQGIVHRDIKGGNILFTKNAVVKLADFGFAVILTDNEKTNSVVGTPYWMSPEVIESKGNMSPACDIWSLGCTIIELLTGQPPYFNLELYGAMFRIVTDEHPPLPEGISENLHDFFKRCFVKDPDKRSTAKDLLKHKWITSPNFPNPVMSKENKDKGENLGIFNAAIFNAPQKERSNSGTSSNHTNDRNKSVDSGHLQLQPKETGEENHGTNEEEENYSTQEMKSIYKKRRVNSNTQNEIQRNISENNIELKQRALISPRHPLNDQITIFDKINDIKQEKPKGNYKNARNTLNNNIKNFDGAENIVYTHNNYSDTPYQKDKEFSPGNVRPTKKTLTDQGKNNIENQNQGTMINANKKLSKNSSQNSIKKGKKSYENIKISQNLEKANFKPSISFQDEGWCNKTTNSDEEKEVIDFLTEINSYANVLKDARKQTIKQYLDDAALKNSFQDFLKKTNNPALFMSEVKTNMDIRNNFEYLNYTDKLNDKQLLVVLINLANFVQENKKATIEYFYKFGIPTFTNILNYPNLNNRLLFVYLFIVNQLITDENGSDLLEELILFQFFIYVTKLAHVFPDWEIKAEISLIIVEIINRPILLKQFISAGGFFILPNLLDPYLIKSNSEHIVIIAINIINEIFEQMSVKKTEIAAFFINNKLLSRINVLLFEIFSDESFAENENLILLLERILDLILTFTETKNMEKICADNLIITLMNLCYNFPQYLVIKIVKIFDNMMKDSSTKNKLENLGIMDFLVKLLDANMNLTIDYQDSEAESQLFQKITKMILHQIRLMCKLNSARVEQLAILDSIPLFLNLTSKNKFNEIIIPIFSEMISSTKIVRDILKDHFGLQTLLNFIKNFQMYASELISKIVFWLSCDKEYIENIVLQDNFFETLFKEIFNVHSDNFKNLVSVLLNFFETSNKIMKKFFDHQDFSDTLMRKLKENYTDFRDTTHTKKILDIIEHFIIIKQNPELLDQYHINEILDNTLAYARSKELVIIEEKINNIMVKKTNE